jgi:hypothetical protein
MAIQKVNGTQSWIARPSVAKKARSRQLRGATTADSGKAPSEREEEGRKRDNKGRKRS